MSLDNPRSLVGAACLGMTHLFFPEIGETAAAAKRVCDGCPVRVECREAGMSEVCGVWGGMTVRERKRRSGK